MLLPCPSDALSGKAGEEILALAGALRAAHPDVRPVAFWDFDGTLFEGDCSEGFLSGNGTRIAGLAEAGILAGWSRQYPASGGFEPFWRDYSGLMKRAGQAAAYVYLVRAFAGAPESAMREMASREFEGRLRPWFFQDALDLWRQLEAGGVSCQVISASPDFFIKGAATALGVPEDRLHGLRLGKNADGILLSDTLEPVTIGPGKALLLRELLASQGPGAARAVAGFGNDFITDGPMLEAVASSILPLGRPFAALVNQPLPAASAGLFRELTFAIRTDPQQT